MSLTYSLFIHQQTFESGPVFFDQDGHVISAAEAGYIDEEAERQAVFYDQYGGDQAGDGGAQYYPQENGRVAQHGGYSR